MNLTSVSGPAKHEDITNKALARLLESGPKTDGEILDHFDVKDRNWDGARGGKLWSILSVMMNLGRIERISMHAKEDAGKLRLPEPPTEN